MNSMISEQPTASYESWAEVRGRRDRYENFKSWLTYGLYLFINFKVENITIKKLNLSKLRGRYGNERIKLDLGHHSPNPTSLVSSLFPTSADLLWQRIARLQSMKHWSGNPMIPRIGDHASLRLGYLTNPFVCKKKKIKKNKRMRILAFKCQ